jgi:hypothetical protein
MKYSRGTFSGLKTTLCTPEITVLRHYCTIEGQTPVNSDSVNINIIIVIWNMESKKKNLLKYDDKDEREMLEFGREKKIESHMSL